MRNKVSVIFFCFVLTFFSACDSHREVRLLFALADSLSYTDPKHALQMLDSFQPRVESLPRQLRMQYHLLHTRAKDKAYIPIADDSIMDEVAHYYRHHGTANQAMESTYLYGGVCRDRGESPRALDVYERAASLADTTRSDCDYGLLARIHGQMAELYEKQFHPYMTCKEAESSMYYFLLAKDTISYYIAMSSKCAAYSFLSQDDSVRYISEKMYHGLKDKGNESLATTSLFPALYICLKYGNVSIGEKYLKVYEKPIIRHENSFRKDQIAGLYQAKAMLAYQKGQIDSAIFYFHKQIYADSTFNTMTMAYDGLKNCYARIGNNDSLCFYTELYCRYNDSTINNNNALTLERIHLTYNYKRNEKIANQKAQEALHNRYKVVMLLFLLIVIILSSIFLYYRQKHLKRKEFNTLCEQYETTLCQLEHEKEMYEKIYNQKYNSLLEEQQVIIIGLQKKLKTIRSKFNTNLDIDYRIIHSKIREKFKKNASGLGNDLTNKDWEMLKDLIETEIPLFRQVFFNENCRITKTEYKLCLLIRMYFTPKEMANLFEISQQNISVMRHRLYKKVFAIEGNSKDFDKKVQQIGKGDVLSN